MVPPSHAQSRDAFADPPKNTRILKIIHNWPDAPAAQDQLIAQLKSRGFGGVVCNVAFDGYLESEAKWEAFTRVVSQTRSEGMALWLYDEKGYPSGTAGGIVLRDHPEWAARGLLVADAVTEGQAVTLDQPPGTPILSMAFPIRNGQIDLAGGRDLSAAIASGKLNWTPPPGSWHVMLFTDDAILEGTHAALNVFAKQAYVNILLAEPTARFLDLTHDAYAKRLGPDLGKIFEATFTDEPSLMTCFLRPMPWRVLPWSQKLAAEFERRRGRPLAPLLPALVADAGPEGARARHDFWLTIADLVSENFFGQIQARCAQYHIPSGGHLLIEEAIAAHVPFYGDFFRCLRKLDAPSIDCLTSLPDQVPWHIARMVRSAADLEGKTLVMCETSDHSQRYRPAGDARPKRQVTEAEIRGTCNRLFAGGVNAITSYYSFAGLDDAALRRLNEWVGRCCTLLRGTQSAADVALLYPAESLWTHTVASRHSAKDSPGAQKIQERFLGAANALFAGRREFTIVDSRTLAEAAIRDGCLTHGALRWRVVVLPRIDTLPIAATEKLRQFAAAGGIVVALDALPENSESEFPSARTAAIAAELFGPPALQARSQGNASGGGGIFLPRGSEDLLPVVLDGVLDADVRCTSPAAPCRITHRRAGGQELYFVFNDGPDPWRGELAFRAAGHAERLHPGRGTTEPLEKGADAPPPVAVQLDPYDAAFFRFERALPSPLRHLPAGTLPGLVLLPLPEVPPTAGAGPTVKSELAPVPTPKGPEAARWQAKGTLSATGVDSWLFLRFAYPAPIDLHRAFCLVVDCELPPGQAASAPFFAYLHEPGGASYIASAGCSASDAGKLTLHIPLDRFKPFGTSADPDGKLNLEKISAISFGWGGYKAGSQGDRILFTVAPPSAALREMNSPDNNRTAKEAKAR